MPLQVGDPGRALGRWDCGVVTTLIIITLAVAAVALVMHAAAAFLLAETLTRTKRWRVEGDPRDVRLRHEEVVFAQNHWAIAKARLSASCSPSKDQDRVRLELGFLVSPRRDRSGVG